jgi:hypothetical protein
MEHGSFHNGLFANAKQPKPEVGMGATVLGWSDRHAGTVIEVSKSGKRIKVRLDKATRIDKNGMSESQEYTYEPDPDGTEYTFSLRQDGKWRLVGEAKGKTVALGYRRHYHDFSF